ncbi:unnamed protein product [Mytilus coruscus]|uniref:G-protein coupled receptors family 1 profile domain-containing protein n=1 Tax=Mytilus coruscus TaxID=42192 RepID=A0A6J8CK34_MYTCO|nr:unnamed protein product [Mytilus coruscus]
MDASNTSFNSTDWIQEYRKNVNDNTILLVVYMIVGILGNSIVILVYKFQFKDTSDERYFVPVLAFFDLIASVLCSLNGIIVNSLQFTLTDDLVWDVLYFVNGIATFTTIHLLLCIAIQRYLKICRQQFLTLKRRRSMIVLSCIFALMLALPLPFSYEVMNFTHDGKVIGTRPTKIRYKTKAATVSYGIAASLFVILVYITFIVLYGKIGCTLYRHFQEMTFKQTFIRLSKKIRLSANEYNEQHVEKKFLFQAVHFSPESEINQTDHNIIDASINKHKTNSAVLLETPNECITQSNIPTAGKIDNITETLKTNSPTSNAVVVYRNALQKRNRKVKNKFTLMYLAITIVFLICFAPVAILLTIEGFNPKFWETLQIREWTVVLYFCQLYIINNIVNPFIYAFIDIEFRRSAITFVYLSVEKTALDVISDSIICFVLK